MPTQTYEERAETGATMLDRIPALDGWDRQMNRATLDMASWSKCAGGQLFGSYDAFARQVGMGSRCDEERAAFNPEGPDDAQQLTLAWIVLLEERESERLTRPARLLA
jgi:hypothetical protein